MTPHCKSLAVFQRFAFDNGLTNLFPSVNEIFDPRQIANVYNRDPVLREATIASEKHTNYGVVSLELLERIYNDLYIQSLRAGRKSEWQHHILRYRTITSVESRESGVITLRCSNGTSLYEICDDAAVEEQDFDLVVLATGYMRNAHTSLLQSTQHLLLPEHQNVGGFTSWAVAKDYSVKYDDDKVDRNVAGVWLQGCNERTHGVCISPQISSSTSSTTLIVLSLQCVLTSEFTMLTVSWNS